MLVVTEAFEGLAKLAAEREGLADMRRVVIPHPLGGLPLERVDEIATVAARELAQALALWDE